MKYLITGANGQLGRELQKQLNNDDHKLFLYDIDSMDITDYEQVKKIVSNIRPDVIFNCAAHTNVDGCENDIENAYKINAIGAQNLAMISDEIGSKFVHFSTDYVFSGEDEIWKEQVTWRRISKTILFQILYYKDCLALR